MESDKEMMESDVETLESDEKTLESNQALHQQRNELRVRMGQYFDLRKSPNYNLKLYPNLFVSICNPNGYHISRVNAEGCFTPTYSKWTRHADDEIILIEPLLYYTPSSLIVLVKTNSDRSIFTLELENTESGVRIETDIRFKEPILTCTSNKHILIVCLKHDIFIYSIKFTRYRMKHSERKLKTPRNEHGVCALAIGHLAYPWGHSRGVVEIRKTCNLIREQYLSAHDEPVIALAFNAVETRLASATHKCIRIFSVGNWDKIYEFSKNIPEIPNLYFSFGYISCSSASATIHIFKLEEANKHLEPSGVNYSFTVKEPHPIQKVVAIKFIYQVLHVFVISETGVYTAYKYNPTTDKFNLFCVENMTAKLLLHAPMTTSSDEDEDLARTL